MRGKALDVENKTSKGLHAGNYKRFRENLGKLFYRGVRQDRLEFLASKFPPAHR